jgi:hypothetical protein
LHDAASDPSARPSGARVRAPTKWDGPSNLILDEYQRSMLEGVCGRYVSVAERGEPIELYNATAVGEELPVLQRRTDQPGVGVVAHRAQDTGEVDRQIRSLKWGLVPSWAKDPKIGNRLINARVETLAVKPATARLCSTPATQPRPSHPTPTTST